MLFAKNLKTKKRIKNLIKLNLDYFLSRLEKNLLNINLSYINRSKYIFYFIYYYLYLLITKYLYKIYFIIRFKIKINSKLKKF